jgi:UDP-N-acetyl-D-mannosaminuronic acid dehydrogenase
MSLEAAEMVKLVCNAHTDLLYGYGNEVALMAEALGLDADEIIRAANVDYPRPDLCRPGFVGGSCLTKDPYLLSHSLRNTGYVPEMVQASRRLNERLPGHVARRVLSVLGASHPQLGDCRVLLAGVAYKGRPETDDTRGAPSEVIAAALRDQIAVVLGHDYVVSHERVAALGMKPVDLAEGFAGSDAVLFLTDHPRYLDEDVLKLANSMRKPAVVFDAWGCFKELFADSPLDDVVYMRLGRG